MGVLFCLMEFCVLSMIFSLAFAVKEALTNEMSLKRYSQEN